MDAGRVMGGLSGRRFLQREVGSMFVTLEGKAVRGRPGMRPSWRQPEGEGEGGKGSNPDGAIAPAEGAALPAQLLSLIGRFSSRRV